MINYIDTHIPHEKRIVLRVDLNVPISLDNHVADDTRIRHIMPTIELLLQNQNKLILISHLGKPKPGDISPSLLPVANNLQSLLPTYEIIFVKDFHTYPSFLSQSSKQIIVLENIRFFPQESLNDPFFARQLAALGEIYINEAFSVSHRMDASIVGIPRYLPSYGGLALQKEVTMLSKIRQNPPRPFTAIVGGAKIATKIDFLKELLTIGDTILLGGGIANTFMAAKNIPIGNSLVDVQEIEKAKMLLSLAQHQKKQLLIPQDVCIGDTFTTTNTRICSVSSIPASAIIGDLGPLTITHYNDILEKSKTILWNGPLGYIENSLFQQASKAILDTMIHASGSITVVGGGDTLRLLANTSAFSSLSYVSLGGGAMLAFFVRGTLPGLDVLT